MKRATSVTACLAAIMFVSGSGLAQQPSPPDPQVTAPASPSTVPSTLIPPTASTTRPSETVTPPSVAPSAPPAVQPLSLAGVLSAALQQVSALQQAQIDEAVAAEELRQAEVAVLPRARASASVSYNSPARHPAANDVPSFIAQNAVHEYHELIGGTGDLTFRILAAIRRGRALLDAAKAGTEIARRALVRGVGEAYYGSALATSKRSAAEHSLAAAEAFERITDLNYRGGEVPEIDTIRARLQTAARRDDLAQARQAEAIANATLGTLLGYGISRAPSIEALPQSVDVREIDTITSAGVTRPPG